MNRAGTAHVRDRIRRNGRPAATMHAGSVVRMKQASKGRGARHATDGNATTARRPGGRGRLGHMQEWRNVEEPAVHAHATANDGAHGAVDAHAMTGAAADTVAARAETRMPPAGRPATARACRCLPDTERQAPTPARAPIHRAALVIQPYSLFCIVLVGELPTDFPDRAVGES
ncbi:conserved hypothetical protein [Burkholderia latens]